jgi:hypothetical protein
MAEFNVRSDSVNVEQIMEQIRARIREKRGVDYTEAEIRDLAAARLERFIDPDKLRSNLLREFHRVRAEGDAPQALDAAIDESVLFETHRPWLRAVRKLLRPILKLFLNTKALAALSARSKAELARKSHDQLTFEIIHNMVVEMTRLGIEVKNLSMRLESVQSRLEFNERRARALESAVVYKPSEPQVVAETPRPHVPEPRPPEQFRAPTPAAPPSPGAVEGAGQRRRRRRRRGRRAGGQQPWQQNQPHQQGQADASAPAAQPAPPQDLQMNGGPADEPHDSDVSDTGDAGFDPDPQ